MFPSVMFMVKLCNDLKVAIIRAGKTNVQVAREVGVTPNYISQIITGKREPSFSIALRILKALGVDTGKIEDVFWIEESPGE